MIPISQEFQGEDERYWYPGTPVMSENKRFGCDAADAENEEDTVSAIMIPKNKYFFVIMTDII
ncbi:hypothetical protein [Methanogenium cariaci]|uniref:hypothetical protein n=1 Tax=Methanogenium cariaci TaxID=2197 RepID=UPI0012F65C78|nr:hypothetical protein [Methanogenium cariaci]